MSAVPARAADAPPSLSSMELLVLSTPRPPTSLEDPLWNGASVASVSQYHPKSSDHRPNVSCRVLYDADALYLRFDVEEDKYIVARNTKPNSPVYQDSCVEFFFAPASGYYINIETNPVGASLVQLHTRPREGECVSDESVEAISRSASLLRGRPAEPLALEGPTSWRVGLTIPIALVAALAGDLGLDAPAPAPGVAWSGNFYKCGDAVADADGASKAHWGAWSAIGDKLDFHQPDHFGKLVFSARSVPKVFG